jgi:hypothetical protein
MNQIIIYSRKFTLVALILSIALTAVPFSTVAADGLSQDTNPPTKAPAAEGNRLAKVWERLNKNYDRQGILLDRATTLISKIQARIDQGTQNGKDTSGVQAALDVFAQAVKDATPIHLNAGAMITAHTGFDENGKVTDRAQALETVQSLGKSLKEARTLFKEPFKLLREAIKAFRESNRPTSPASTPKP